MGIPRFFYWLYKEYPQSLFRIYHKQKFASHKISVDAYALDLNAIVHPICQQVFQYGDQRYNSEKNVVRLLHDQCEYANKRVECYNKICRKIDELVNLVSPEKKLIIALDGVAGMSKQKQQRQRRYKHILSGNPKYECKNRNDVDKFDPNEITTGTQFMFELSQCIREFIQHKMKHNEYWSKLQIFFSSDQEAGEGEHKIIHILKKTNTFASYCIHSPDADLIMLSLSSICTHSFTKCYILRENIYDHIQCLYFVVDVSLFAECLFEKFKQFSVHSVQQSQPLKKQILTDFIFFCLFFGNDFLPENPLILTNKQGMDILFVVYIETLINAGNLTFVCDESKTVTLNIKSLEFFLEKLSEHEGTFLQQKQRLEVNNVEQFRDLVYCNNHVTDQIDNLCEEYLKGIHFVLTYYMFDIPDWHWYYPFHCSPFFSDLHSFTKRKHISFDFSKNHPLTPFEQLLAVLPPQSCNLLPSPLSELMTNPNSAISRFYNTCSVIEDVNELPNIDVHLLQQTFINVVNNKCEEMKKELTTRNVFCNTQIFCKKKDYFK